MNKATIKTGNRCGHDKLMFRNFVSPENHKKRPDILKIAAENASKLKENHEKYLPNLRYANGNARVQRSERRECEGALMQVLLHYTDLATLEVGTPDRNGVINGLRIGFIAEKLNFGDKRVWRAMNDLKQAGYLSIRTRKTKVENNFYSISNIKLSQKAFYELGIGQLSLQISRHYKIKSLQKRTYNKKQTWYNRPKSANGVNLSRQSVVEIGKILGQKKRTSAKQATSHSQDVAMRKRRDSAVYRLMLEKGISSSEAYKQLGYNINLD